ncbi:MAG TPA: hypothetical protein PLK77_05610 [Pyrinomonadaceae bacterium]|nr:hypothetical protein [Pyrinomonadaceae bacterium]
MYERFKEDQGQAFSEFTDGDHARPPYLKWIAAGLAVNLLSWIVAIITPEAIAFWIGFVADLSDKVKAWLLAFPFWSTFFAAYASFRLPRCSNPTASLEDGDIMASYRDTEKSNYIRNRVLLALGVAAVNTIVLVFVVIWLGEGT